MTLFITLHTDHLDISYLPMDTAFTVLPHNNGMEMDDIILVRSRISLKFSHCCD